MCRFAPSQLHSVRSTPERSLQSSDSGPRSMVVSSIDRCYMHASRSQILALIAKFKSCISRVVPSGRTTLLPLRTAIFPMAGPSARAALAEGGALCVASPLGIGRLAKSRMLRLALGGRGCARASVELAHVLARMLPFCERLADTCSHHCFHPRCARNSSHDCSASGRWATTSSGL